MFARTLTILLACTWLFSFVCVRSEQTRRGNHGGSYTREFLLSLRGAASVLAWRPDTDFPGDLTALPTNTINGTSSSKKRKRGKKGGVRQRLKTLNNRKTPLPTVIFSNVRSLRPKTDELQANVNYMHEFKKAGLLAFTETWLDNTVANNELHIEGFGVPIRLDRDKIITGKGQGGGVCFYVNEKWCKTVKTRASLCTPDVELLSISLRPFYLPREFPQLFFTVVYIHPRANTERARELIMNHTHTLDSISPDAPKFILGDFNNCSISKSLKTYEQYVSCPTRKNKIIDLCYGSVTGAYKSWPLPPLGTADHNCVLLAPLYKPVFQRLQPLVKTVKNWTADSIESLKGCFECTDWDMFYNGCANVNELADVISSYISFCVNRIIPTKQITIYPNNKPWVTKDLKCVLNKKKVMFYTGTVEENKQVNKEVKAAIQQARQNYKNKIERRFAGNSFRAAWQGIKNMSAVNMTANTTRTKISLKGVCDDNLPDHLNEFFTRFEKFDFTDDINDLKQSLSPENNIIVDEDNVARLFKKININKSSGPDGINGRTLKFCASELAGVFQHLFQSSLDSCQIPVIWKTSKVVPLPKKSNPTQPNDFRPVALTSLVMKTLEKIVKSLILSDTEKNLDPLQFAYRSRRGVEDAKLFILNKLYNHLETPNSHARILFADFSSAFNTMQPHVLLQTLLSKFNVGNQLVLWLIDFLTNRPQRVLVNGILSSLRFTFTGSPQGCVLSPLLYILYTDDCRSSYENSFLVKFADDSALLSLLSGPMHDHGPALNEFVSWCDKAYLELNVLKTKDLPIDFRKSEHTTNKTIIHDQEVEIVSSYKYLGTVFDCNLNWNANTEAVVKKGQQRIYFLRKLRSFSVDRKILCLFYQSYIESVLSFAFICWYHNLSVKNRNELQRIVKICSKIIGEKQRDLTSFCEKQLVRKAITILTDSTHVLFPEFQSLPSGRRFQCPNSKTNRKRNSFVPTAIRLLNKM